MLHFLTVCTIYGQGLFRISVRLKKQFSPVSIAKQESIMLKINEIISK